MTTDVESANAPSSDSRATLPARDFVEEERYGAGDTYLVRDVLPPGLREGAFERLCDEVQWCTMSHRGGEVPRLVAVEGTVDEDGSIPVYRHPADTSPPLRAFSPTVALIREHVARFLPADQPLNHVLVQRYRSGKDYISEHADKTVDVVHGSYIVKCTVSLGAQRTMKLRTKKSLPSTRTRTRARASKPAPAPNPAAAAAAATDRTTHHIPLPHNSALLLGLTTNRLWLHSIRPDRRPRTLLSAPEAAFGRERISLTFRSIGTFLSPSLCACPDRKTSPSPRKSKSKSPRVSLEGGGTRTGTESRTETETETGRWVIWGQGARGKTRAAAHPVSANTKERKALLRAFGEENHSSAFDWDAAYGKGFDVVHFT